MNYRVFASFLLVLTHLTLTSGAHAQFTWQISHPAQAGRFHYSFAQISSFGECCSAAGRSVDDSAKPRTIRTVIFRSNDGGLSWTEQYPGSPRWLGFSGIQQIDSLNVVAIGDSGLVERTFDGGQTWESQRLPVTGRLFDVNFSNPMTGMVIGPGKPDIFATSDGGRHWNSFAIGEPYFPIQGHATGDGRFQAISFYAGPIYFTTDYWRSVDSSTWIYPDSDQTHGIVSWNFLNNDTLVAFGTHWRGSQLNIARLLLVRSTNAGRSWSEIQTIDSLITPPYVMSPLNRDLVVLGGNCNALRNTIAFSSNHGESWTMESLPSDTSFLPFIIGLTVTPRNEVLAIFSPDRSAYAIIGRGVRGQSHVENFEQIVFGTHIYPNPSTNQVTITSVEHSRTIRLIDVLGREVLHDVLSANGKATLNVASLPRGIYSVILDHNGITLTVGKVAVIDRE